MRWAPVLTGWTASGVVALVVVCLAAVVIPALMATATSSPPGDVLVVDDSLESVDETACSGATYPTIQEAITAAAEGDVVRVCSGNYTEQVDIETQELTVRADGGAKVHTLVGYAFDVRASQVTLRGFDIFAPGKGGISVRGEKSHILNNTIIAAKDGSDVATSQQAGRGGAGYLQVNGNAQAVLPGVHWTTSHRTGGTHGKGIYIYADDTLIRGNSIEEHGTGMVVWGAKNVVIRDNFVRDSIDDEPEDGIVVIGNASATITENTVTRNEDGVVTAGNVTVVRNNITRNANDGVDIGARYNVDVPNKSARVRVLDNQLTQNGQYAYGGSGILLRGEAWDPENIVITRNVINGNSYHGINNEEVAFNNEHQIVNATNNYWGCGGPSSGLRDPYTNRTANGSGDSVSPSENPGETNVHFDPFLERSSCPTGGSTPTSTPEDTVTGTPTLTPTKTSTSTPGGTTETPTATRTPTPATPAGNGGGPGPGNGSTGVQTVSGPGGNILGIQPAYDTPKPPQTPTQTPTPTLPPTVTPTPRAEPGFGVLGWLVALVCLVGLLGFRRRVSHGEDD